jgi:hypothetical protein
MAMQEPLHQPESHHPSEQWHASAHDPSPEHIERSEHIVTQAAAPVEMPPSPATDAPVSSDAPTEIIKDPELITIENILAEHMDDFFKSLSRQQQQEFKETGEMTAVRIRTIIHQSVYRIKDIVSLIVQWLRTLPGINRFFLEQEAKIKADKIISIYK